MFWFGFLVWLVVFLWFCFVLVLGFLLLFFRGRLVVSFVCFKSKALVSHCESRRLDQPHFISGKTHYFISSVPGQREPISVSTFRSRIIVPVVQ